MKSLRHATNTQKGPAMTSRLLFAVVAVATAVATGAPPALAQTEPFNATYQVRYGTRNGALPQQCPDGAYACGKGTSAAYGAFTDEFDFTGPGTAALTLTFPDGSTLMLDETLVSFSFPGSSGAHAPPSSYGHPETSQSSYVIAGATGTFAGATGSGTDNFHDAGNVGFGTLSGTITQ
jgi:hypothetical protein